MVKEKEPFYLEKAGPLIVGRFSLLQEAGLQHAMSTRLGGISKAPWRSLNLGYHVGDCAEDVTANRKHFCEAVGAEASNVVALQQVHGNRVVVVDEGQCGQGAFAWDGALAGTDAVVTAAKGVPLLLLVADCVPVLLFDPVHRVLALAHAGWKGTVTGIAVGVLEVMKSHFGSKAEECLAALGPSIGQCCYPVGEAVLQKLPTNLPEGLLRSEKGEKRLDLRGLNAWLLSEAGIPPQQIADAGGCTCCRKDLLFSHRGDSGHSGRLGLLAWL
nr:peptidoglycan editing factor PgeF [uncultured Anaeromusa sp.]